MPSRLTPQTTGARDTNREQIQHTVHEVGHPGRCGGGAAAAAEGDSELSFLECYLTWKLCPATHSVRRMSKMPNLFLASEPLAVKGDEGACLRRLL